MVEEVYIFFFPFLPCDFWGGYPFLFMYVRVLVGKHAWMYVLDTDTM